MDRNTESNMTHLASTNEETNMIISMAAVTIFNWVVWAILSQVVVMFGIISNIVNIVCFVKQGFRESINVSLTGLAISDLGCLLPIIWTNVCFTPAFYNLDWTFEPTEAQYMTSGITHVTFTRISSWLTAMVTIDRCLCVAMPLKVKEISTPRRTFIVIAVLFSVLFAGTAPRHYYYRLCKKYYPERNKTLFGIMYTKELLDFENISYPINIAFVQFSAFVVIIICTTILVIELNIKAKWRKTSATSSNTAKLARSNTNVAKMVVMISVLFIISFLPIIVIAIAITVVPEFTIDGKLRHLLTACGGVGYLMESINSASNIFIYYKMSSKYRDVFLKMFSCDRCRFTCH